jgi:hypothetical protein
LNVLPAVVSVELIVSCVPVELVSSCGSC